MMVGTHTGTGYSLNAYAYLLASLLLLVSATTVAAPAPVTIESMSGTVEYRQSDTTPWARASAGIWLAMPVEIKTGPDAQARITQSGTSLDIGPSTRLTLSSNENTSDGLMSRVKQWLGTVFYEVERQPDTFQVETPFLVSTVKGTQFTIATTETSSLVTLNEGSLEVRDLQSGELRLLLPGDIAGVTSSQSGIQSLQQAPNAISPEAQTEALNLALPASDVEAETLLNEAIAGNDVVADQGDETIAEQELGRGDSSNPDQDLGGDDDLGADDDLGGDVDLGDDDDFDDDFDDDDDDQGDDD